MVDFVDYEIVKGNRMVVWEYIGEGMSGDYDPTDEDDTPLLRFSCYAKNEDGQWEQMDDASYCTLMPLSSPVEHLETGALSIFDAIENASYKKELEYLSWFNPDDFDKEKV